MRFTASLLYAMLFAFDSLMSFMLPKESAFHPKQTSTTCVLS
jgi:hypothetical protein